MGLFGMAASYLAFSVLHFFQFVLAVTVCGLYAVDLNNARSHGDYTDGKWVRLFPRFIRPTPCVSIRDEKSLG